MADVTNPPVSLGTGQWAAPNSFAGVIQTLQQTNVALYTLQQTINKKFPDWVTAPAHSNSVGTAGQVAYNSSNFYVCVATNTWGYVALTFSF